MKRLDSKNILRISFHVVLLGAAFILGFFVVAKGVKFDFKKKPVQQEVVKTEVVYEYLDPQLLQDWKDKVLDVNGYFKNILFAEYDKEYLTDRYYPLKRLDIPYDTDFIANTYGNKISDTVLKYYLNRVLLTGVTFDTEKENDPVKDDDIIAFANEVHASDVAKKINLNKVVVSGNGNFVVWYTTTGGSAITKEQAQNIAYNLELSRYAYDNMYRRHFEFDADFYNDGIIPRDQLKVYNKYGVISPKLTNAMQVYVVDYAESAAKYVLGGKKLTEMYDKFQYGSEEGSIPGPYLLIRASSYKTARERTMQIANRELFRHYQYNVYCPDESCVINDDPYYFDALANFGSAVATKKVTYKGFLNDWAAFARDHTGDLLSNELLNKYGSKNIANALFVYLYYYSKFATDGNTRLIDALYKQDPFKVLESQTTDEELTLIQQEIAMDYLNQKGDNANLIASPEVESTINAKDSFDDTANVDQENLNKLGIDYYVINRGEHPNLKIEFGRASSKVTCVLVGVRDGVYTKLATAPVGRVNVQFNTSNYALYDQYYVVIANTSMTTNNIYSLDIKVQ